MKTILKKKKVRKTAIQQPELNPSALTNSTNSDKFLPTPSMRVWVETAVAMATDCKADIAKECRLHRSTWYKWLMLPGFEEWYYEMYRKLRTRWIPLLDRMGMEQAKKNYQYWEAMNIKAGENLKPQEKDTPSLTQQNNYFYQMNDEQLRQYIESKHKQFRASTGTSGNGTQESRESTEVRQPTPETA